MKGKKTKHRKDKVKQVQYNLQLQYNTIQFNAFNFLDLC